MSAGHIQTGVRSLGVRRRRRAAAPHPMFCLDYFMRHYGSTVYFHGINLCIGIFSSFRNYPVIVRRNGTCCGSRGRPVPVFDRETRACRLSNSVHGWIPPTRESTPQPASGRSGPRHQPVCSKRHSTANAAQRGRDREFLWPRGRRAMVEPRQRTFPVRGMVRKALHAKSSASSHGAKVCSYAT